MREVILLSSQAKILLSPGDKMQIRISQKCWLEVYAEFKTA